MALNDTDCEILEQISYKMTFDLQRTPRGPKSHCRKLVTSALQWPQSKNPPQFPPGMPSLLACLSMCVIQKHAELRTYNGNSDMI